MGYHRTAKLSRNERGGVAVITAIMIPLLIGMAGLVAEYGNGLLTKVEDQRVADLAAFAGALAYNSTGTTSAMTSAAQAVALLNSIPSGGVSASLVTSPTGDGDQAVMVSISTQRSLLLAPVLGGGSQLTASASAYAELKPNTSGCIVALSTSGTGVTLSGGTAVTASGCAVSSNKAVTAPCGTTISTIEVDYDTSVSECTTPDAITAPSGKTLKMVDAKTADPLASNSEVTTATARLSTVSGLTTPTFTAPPASSISPSFGWSSSPAPSLPAGCSGSWNSSSSTWTVTCAQGGTYDFNTFTVPGGMKVNVVLGSGSGTTTFNFSGSINDTGSSLSFPNGNYTVAQGITTGGGSTTTFGTGTFNVGPSTSACNGGGKYSICNTGTSLTFGGPSTFVLSGGVYNSGGSQLTLGSGSTNSFNIGESSDGNAVYAGGGSTTVFADATGGSDLFQLDGNFDLASGGGSCMTISAAAEHDIKGYFSTAGGNTLGAGVYTVTGYIALGANGGGDVSCGGSTVGLSGTGVTFVTGASSTIPSGTCSGEAFCIASGYNHVSLTAPTSGATAELAVVGPTSVSNTAGATFAEGANATSVSGAFYFPNGAISLSGGASLGNGSGQCLELVGSQVTLSGGTALASTCLSGGSSSSGEAVLVQ